MTRDVLFFCISITVVSIYCSCKENRKSKEEINQSKMVLDPTKKVTSDLKATADSLYFANKYREAVSLYDELIKRDSLQGEYYYRRAFSNSNLLKKNMAIKDYLKAIDLNYKVDAAYFNAGINCSFDNDSLALLFFQKCLEANPNYPDAEIEIKECRKRLNWKKEGVIHDI